MIGKSLVLCSAVAMLAACTQPRKAPFRDPLTSLNSSFKKSYKEARTTLLARTGPVIIVQFDDLILRHGGKVTRAKFTPPIYHQAKAFAHIPLALYVMLAPRTDQPLSAAFLGKLKAYRAQVVTAEKTLPSLKGWTPKIVATHLKITKPSLAYIDRILTNKRASRRGLTAYSRAMRGPVLASADVAGRAQLDGLHKLTSSWRKQLGRSAWQRLHVVVLGPRQPRVGNLQYVYFRRLLGRAAEGKRLFYAEGTFSVKGGEGLLGTILLDRGASIAFFGDPVRLERDLLADVATRHIRRLFSRR